MCRAIEEARDPAPFEMTGAMTAAAPAVESSDRGRRRLAEELVRRGRMPSRLSCSARMKPAAGMPAAGSVAIRPERYSGAGRAAVRVGGRRVARGAELE